MILHTSQKGRSMVEMLGVLAIVAAISVGGLAGFGKAMYQYEFSKTIDITIEALNDLAFFTGGHNKNKGTYVATTSNMAETARATGLMSGCKPTTSQIADGYSVCQAPLGEIYPRFFVTNDDDDRYYTAMLYVTLLKSLQTSCIKFLTRNWEHSVPKKFWQRGRMWVVSNKGGQTVYSGESFGISVSDATTACNNVCGDDAVYCSIVFDFSGYTN